MVTASGQAHFTAPCQWYQNEMLSIEGFDEKTYLINQFGPTQRNEYIEWLYGSILCFMLDLKINESMRDEIDKHVLQFQS